MSLSTILKEIETNRPVAETEVSMDNPATYNGRLGLKRAAVEALKRLKAQYRNELMGSTAFIVVTGSARDSFTELATSETFGCFTTNPDDFFNDLVSRISPKLFGRETCKNLFNVLDNVIYEKAMELELKEYTPVRYNEKYNGDVSSPEKFVPIVKQAVVEQMGSEIVGVSSVNSIVDTAIKRGHSAPVTPVILSTSDEKFALELQRTLSDLKSPNGLNAKAFLVVAGKASKELKTSSAVVVKTVSEDTVGEALTTIRSKVL